MVVVFYSSIIYAQNLDNGLEKSLFNFQSGVLGLWINNESKISEAIALRTELGLEAGLFTRDFSNNNTIAFLTPTLNVEPRWYYNMKKRYDKLKNTNNNSANFLAISMNYHPDWFVISNSDNIKVYNQLSFIPKWGIRRVIADTNFNFEAGIGLGYRYTFLKQYGFSKNNGETVLDLHLRIGYTFKEKK